MKKEKLQKHLGMAVYFLYYEYERLHWEDTFRDGYCEKLKRTSGERYLTEMKDCLAYAREQDDYCIPIIVSPLRERYTIEEIKLFFDKLHDKLEECLGSYEAQALLARFCQACLFMSTPVWSLSP